jgi:hypothetical protein
MTKEIAETLPMIELAELLIENMQEYVDCEAIDIVDDLDRYDTIRELEDLGVFDEE